MPTTGRKLGVFLCHAPQDKSMAHELYAKLLDEAWIDPWLDEHKLLPGQERQFEIERAVEAADAIIVCISQNSVTKEGHFQRELKIALDIALEKPEGAIFIIPIRLGDCDVPHRIRGWQCLDYFPFSQKQAAFERLVRSLASRKKAIDVLGEPNPLRRSTMPGEDTTAEPPRKLRASPPRRSYAPKDGELAAIFVMQTEDRTVLGEWIGINKSLVTIGRSADNDVVLPNDLWVSRHHATLEYRDGNWYVYELPVGERKPTRPVNGTFVNEQRIDNVHELKDRDVIRLGQVVKLLFREFW